MVDVFATWCGPCQKLDKEVFPTPAVRKEAAGWLAVRVDAESPQGEEVVKRYHVVGYPTVLFLDPAGREIDRVFGFLEAADFAQAMADYAEGKNTIAARQAELKARPDDLALRYEVGRRLAIRGEVEQARALLDAVRAADADNAKGLASQALLTLGKYLYLRGSKDYRAALALLQDLVKRYPDSDEAKAAPYPIARAWHGLGDDAKALASLQALIDAAPGRAGAYNTFAWFCFKEDVDRPRGIAVAQAGLKADAKAAGLWDTLAELYFATGRQAEALDAIRKALALEPDDPYYKGQLERFEKGSTGGPPKTG